MVRFRGDVRESLDTIAEHCRDVLARNRIEGDPPGDAEIVRALLVCGLLGASTKPQLRLAVVLRANAILSLSGRLKESVGILRQPLEDLSGSLVKVGAATIRQTDVVAHKTPRRERKDPAQIPDRNRVHLVLDEWLFRALENRSQQRDVADAAPRSLGAESVRCTVEDALTQYDSHIGVVAAYACTIGRVRKIISDAVEGGRRAIANTIEASIEHVAVK